MGRLLVLAAVAAAAAGYYPRFGFFSYDPVTLARRERPSARLFRRIARTGKIEAASERE